MEEYLDTAIIHFGKIEIKDMYLISPAFMLGISTYHNILTINASYYSPGINHNEIKELLTQMDSVLKRALHS